MMVMTSSCNMEGLEAGQQENILPPGQKYLPVSQTDLGLEGWLRMALNF